MKKNLIMVTEPVWNFALKKLEVCWKYEGEEKQIKLFKRKEKARSFVDKLLAKNEN